MAAESIQKVVLIDDNDIDLFVQRRFIENTAFAKSIGQYQSPTEALSYFATLSGSAPEVIFLDLNMPEMDGFTFLKHFEDLPQQVSLQTRVIILTSSSSAQDRERALSFKSVIGFVSKPLTARSLEEIRSKVLSHLFPSRARNENPHNIS